MPKRPSKVADVAVSVAAGARGGTGGVVDICDVAIIGSGPAAMTAALYAARENLSVCVYEREVMGGLAATISEIENFPGFSGTGAELMDKMRAQAESFGAKVDYGECTALRRLDDGGFELEIDGEMRRARAVIVATGSERRKLGIPGEDLPAVSYCATCDGPMTSGKDVVVVGGANSAVQEAFFLLKYCRSVKMLVRSKLKCNEVLKERLAAEPRIEVILGATPESFEKRDGRLVVKLARGADVVGAAESTPDGELVTDYVFIFAGMKPATGFLPAKVLAEGGSVRTDLDLATDVLGLFAAGDCRYGNVKQAIVAAGEGSAAAVAAGKYLENQE